MKQDVAASMGNKGLQGSGLILGMEAMGGMWHEAWLELALSRSRSIDYWDRSRDNVLSEYRVLGEAIHPFVCGADNSNSLATFFVSFGWEFVSRSSPVLYAASRDGWQLGWSQIRVSLARSPC